MNFTELSNLRIEDQVMWNGGFSLEYSSTRDANLSLEKTYKVISMDRSCSIIQIEDDDESTVWVDAEDFEIINKEQQIEDRPKQLAASSKNFTVTINNDLFLLEAIGLSEEKINKIMDILCK